MHFPGFVYRRIRLPPQAGIQSIGRWIRMDSRKLHIRPDLVFLLSMGLKRLRKSAQLRGELALHDGSQKEREREYRLVMLQRLIQLGSRALLPRQSVEMKKPPRKQGGFFIISSKCSRTFPRESKRARTASFFSFLLSACREVCACGRCRRRRVWR